MKVYLVIEDEGYDGWRIINIYSNEESALKALHQEVERRNSFNVTDKHIMKTTHLFRNPGGYELRVAEWDVTE